MNHHASPDARLRADRALERLALLHPKLIDLGLGRTLRLLEKLGNPHHGLAPTIHVAGTNAKGSVIALMRAMAENAGLCVNTYVSPHLCRFNERIRIGGKLIDDGRLAALLEEVERVNAGEQITYFEITTAAAFLAFARAPGDLLLLETGLGGEFDSTNVIDRPAACVITPVARDHEHFLGSEIAGIARAKAGIIKRDVPCVSAAQETEVAAVLDATATANNTRIAALGRDIHFTETQDGGLVVGQGVDAQPFSPPGLAGAHQLANAALAYAALRTAMPHLPGAELAAGARNASWPGRLERLPKGNLTKRHPRHEIWLDGAHNAHGARALALAVSQIRPGKWHFVCGALNTRPADEFLAHIAPIAASITCVAIPGQEASLDAERLQIEAMELFANAAVAPGIEAALVHIADAASMPPAAGQALSGQAESARGDHGAPVMICGSLYLAGHVLELNDTPPH